MRGKRVIMGKLKREWNKGQDIKNIKKMRGF
jgi:hypothetical protein